MPTLSVVIKERSARGVVIDIHGADFKDPVTRGRGTIECEAYVPDQSPKGGRKVQGAHARLRTREQQLQPGMVITAKFADSLLRMSGALRPMVQFLDIHGQQGKKARKRR